MKKTMLKLVAVYEIVCGLTGLGMVVGGAVGALPYAAAPVLWFGMFPLMCLVAGVSLWARRRYAVAYSIFVLLLQVPLIYVGKFVLNLGLALNFTIFGTWPRQDGRGVTALGINALALGVLSVLLWCRSHWRSVPATVSDDGVEGVRSLV